jgi:hypothetical protein
MKNTVSIISIIKKQDYESAQEIFEKVISRHCTSCKEDVLKVGEPSRIPNQYIFALEVPMENAIEIVKELTYEGISVVKSESFIKIAVNEAMVELQNEQSIKIQQLQKEESLKQKLKKRGDYTIDELVNLKDWQLLLEMALKQSHENIEKSRRIKELLPDVLNEAIENEIRRDTKSLEIAKSTIERLMLIAENATLKRLHLLVAMKKAGEAIIEICKQHPKELIRELIFLANSRSTIPAINIKAFLSFYRVVNADEKNYEEVIYESAKYLNTIALDTVYVTAVKLSAEDKKLFNSGIEYFKEKRKSL